MAIKARWQGKGPGGNLLPAVSPRLEAGTDLKTIQLLPGHRSLRPSRRPAPGPYHHVVFTLPGALGPMALQKQRIVYGILFRASETLHAIARDPKHLRARIWVSTIFPFRYFPIPAT